MHDQLMHPGGPAVNLQVLAGISPSTRTSAAPGALVGGFNWADDEQRGSALLRALRRARIVEALLASFDGTVRRQCVDVTSGGEARSAGCSKR